MYSKACRTSIIGIFVANDSVQSRRLPQNQSKQGYEMVYTNFLQKNDHFRSVIERFVTGQLDQSVMVCHVRPVLILFRLDFSR